MEAPNLSPENGKHRDTIGMRFADRWRLDVVCRVIVIALAMAALAVLVL
jgi:hypothetical protein